jgi:hypothetical protein
MIVIAGAIANKLGNGGEAWVRLSWALGIRSLGYQVLLLETISRKASDRSESLADSRYGHYFEAAAKVGHSDLSARLIVDPVDFDATLIDIDTGETIGRSYAEVEALCSEADLLINISGHLGDPLRSRFRRKAFVDIDPGFTQIWQLERLVEGLDQHDVHFTIAENIGKNGCTLPSAGFDWRSTRQPVTLEHWPAMRQPTSAADDQVSRSHQQVSGPHGSDGCFTTVSTWRCLFGRPQHEGVTYRSKHDVWRELIDLPRLTEAQLEIALAIETSDDADRLNLLQNGWSLVTPQQYAADPESFRAYVQGSHGEFSPAQGIYVDSHSGWFSDRTTRYLASGKPALVQDTGIGENIPIGAGLLTFTDVDSAAAGLNEIVANYDYHCRAAREIAENYFDAKLVLHQFLTDVL